jgi:hypothetical protein
VRCREGRTGLDNASLATDLGENLLVNRLVATENVITDPTLDTEASLPWFTGPLRSDISSSIHVGAGVAGGFTCVGSSWRPRGTP